MTDDPTKLSAAFMSLGVTKTRDLSVREREAIDLARQILIERLDVPRD